MGGGIAQVVAASGRRVLLYDSYPGATERGLATMRTSLESSRRRAAATPTSARARHGGRRSPDRCRNRRRGREAGRFRRADEILPGAVPPRTPSIPITRSPPPRSVRPSGCTLTRCWKLVEIVRGRGRPRDGLRNRRARGGSRQDAGGGNDFPGFVSNWILMLFINEVWGCTTASPRRRRSTRLRSSAFAPDEPLAPTDLIGLDTCVSRSWKCCTRAR
jgi:3-hydroxyacyl-CoA dehydrogenase